MVLCLLTGSGLLLGCGTTSTTDDDVLLVPVLSVSSLNPLSIARFEEYPLSEYTLVMNGYRSMMGDQTSKVILLHNDTTLALWTYDASEIGGISFGHSANIQGDEMILSDTDHDRVVIVKAANGMYSQSPSFQVVWNSEEDTDIQLDYPNDAEFLANGNLLITDKLNHRVIEVNRTSGAIVWQFGETGQTGSGSSHLAGPHNADRLTNGNTIISDSDNRRILEVDPAESIVREFQPGYLNWPRDADDLGDNRLLISDSNNGRVIMVDEAGGIDWEFEISIIGTFSQPYEADLLSNGNVLISCPGMSAGAIYEVDDSTQEVVWSFSP